MSMSETVGSRLKRLRKERDLPQVDVAVAVGISRSTLAGIETDDDPPGRETLLRLADFFGVSVDELYPGASTSSATPKVLERAKDEDEAALLAFWRTLDEAEKRFFLIALTRARDGT